MNNNNNKGQSMVELVFSVGIIVLALTGVVILVINSLGAKTKSGDRTKAAELGEIVVENLVNQKKNDADNFWLLNNQIDRTNEKFPGYVYSITFTNIANNPTQYPTCGLDTEGVGTTNCTEATINIGWSGAEPQNLTFTRFFSKQ